MPEVIIRRGDDGMEFGIDSRDFRRGKHFQKLDGTRVTYEEAGFKIVSLADGSPYEPPAPRSTPAPEERSAP